MSSPDNSNHCWGSQLKAVYGRLQNKALVKSAGFISSLNAMLYQLLSNNFRAPVLLWMALPFRWHLRIKFSFAKGTRFHSYVNAGNRTKSRLQPCPRTFSLSGLFPYSPSVFAFLSGWRNAFLPIAALVLQYVLTKPTGKDFYKAWDLRIYQFWNIELSRCWDFLRSSNHQNRAKNWKKKRFNLSLVIVDRLTMSDACKH